MPWKHIIVSLPAKDLQAAMSDVSSFQQGQECSGLDLLLNVVDHAAFLTTVCGAQLHVMTVSDDATVSECQQEILRLASESGISLSDPVCSVLSPDTWYAESSQLAELDAVLVKGMSQLEAAGPDRGKVPIWYVAERLSHLDGISTAALVPPHCCSEAVVEFVNLAIQFPLRLTLLMYGSEDEDRDQVMAALDGADIRSAEYGVQVDWTKSDWPDVPGRREFDLLMTIGESSADAAKSNSLSILTLPDVH